MQAMTQAEWKSLKIPEQNNYFKPKGINIARFRCEGVAATLWRFSQPLNLISGLVPLFCWDYFTDCLSFEIKGWEHSKLNMCHILWYLGVSYFTKSRYIYWPLLLRIKQIENTVNFNINLILRLKMEWKYSHWRQTISCKVGRHF